MPHFAPGPQEPMAQEPMALVGYGYRLPAGLKTDDEFWGLLCSRKVARVDITKERYDNGQVPWDGQPNPFKYACQWQGVFTGAYHIICCRIIVSVIRPVVF
jgi:acyl transferase domain-containing protein